MKNLPDHFTWWDVILIILVALAVGWTVIYGTDQEDRHRAVPATWETQGKEYAR